jgi:WD40 repeat protein
MAFGGAEEKIYLVDTATGQILDKRVHNDVITNLAFSPNGELIISASCNENPGITIWHLKEETTDRYDVSACLSTVSPTQPLVAISGSGLTAIFDPSNGQFNHMFAEDSGSFSMAFSPDGKVLAAEINGELRFWDLVVANEIMLVPWQDYQSEILFVAWSSNNLLALLSADGTIVVWNVVDQKVIGVGTVQFDFVDNSRMIFSPDGSQLALVDKNGIGIWAIPLPPRE